jgi:hypothetical protein
MDRQSKLIFLVLPILFFCFFCGSMVFRPPFNEGDWVEPRGENIDCFHTPGVNSGEEEPFHFREREKGIIERGGDLNSYYFFDSPTWWMRVDMGGGIHKWCKADKLKLYNPYD